MGVWLKFCCRGVPKKVGGAFWTQRLFCSSDDVGHKYIYDICLGEGSRLLRTRPVFVKIIEKIIEIVSKLSFFETMDMIRYFKILDIFAKMKKIQFDNYTKCNENSIPQANITFPDFHGVSIFCISTW